ncbi:hypothetical protein [Caulobacter sp. 17J80-11]|uniref:hypothetical protein n=1 Tax=Caulobacter sp. 17J80-11 TaxID=2763502 RepID=UPI001653BB0F|nr:hypothetical protein [Caulobacter sp. 17J80-11]MBC6981766.1 hypothetical protein [Caulobacter sp. 17J80-11]
MPVWACLGEAVRFLPRAWSGAWAALILIGLAVGAPVVLAESGWLRANAWASAPIVLAAVAAALVADGALYRLGVFGADARREGLGVAGLQFGRPELRLLAARLLIDLFLLMIGIASVVVLAVALTAGGLGEVDFATVRSLADLRELAGPVELVVTGALVAGIAAVFLLLSVRFSLYGAATLGRRRIVALNALGVAEGAFWPLLLGIVLVSLPATALFVWQHCVSGLTGRNLLIFHGLQALAYAFVQKPLTAGFLSAAYRRLEYLPAGPDGK